jgi:hypothetical protein
MVLGGCATSQVRCLLKECDGDARPRQITGGAQTGHPATNDNDICWREIRFHFCLHFYLIIQVNDLSHKQDRKELAFVTHEDNECSGRCACQEKIVCWQKAKSGIARPC